MKSAAPHAFRHALVSHVSLSRRIGGVAPHYHVPTLFVQRSQAAWHHGTSRYAQVCTALVLQGQVLTRLDLRLLEYSSPAMRCNCNGKPRIIPEPVGREQQHCRRVLGRPTAPTSKPLAFYTFHLSRVHMARVPVPGVSRQPSPKLVGIYYTGTHRRMWITRGSGMSTSRN